jgi:uncharacterized OB-fold protein
MKKINWTEKDLKKIEVPYIICDNCGWLVNNYKPNNCEICSNCGTKYKDDKFESTEGEI